MTNYTFQQITVPGASGETIAYGINDKGQITGSFVVGEPAGSPYPRAFVETNGSVVPVPPSPPAPVSAATGINSQGDISGYDGFPTIGFRSFLYSPDGSVQNIASRPAFSDTFAYGVNDSDAVVGTDTVSQHLGFLWQGGQMSFIQYPGAALTDARGIANDGTIVGFESAGYDANGGGVLTNHAFIDRNGNFAEIQVPGAVSAEANGISSDGTTIVGSYQDAAGNEHGWVDRSGHIQTVDVPGATEARLNGVNDSRELVGSYQVSGDPTQHGFIASPKVMDPFQTFVDILYCAGLGREAEPGGLDGWANLLRTGVLTGSEFVQDLIGSPEGQSLHGQQSDAEYIDSLYVNALGRHAEAAGQAGWVGALQAGASRGDVLAAIAQSPEGEQHFAASHA